MYRAPTNAKAPIRRLAFPGKSARERGLAFAEGVGDAEAKAETALRRGVQVRAKQVNISARAEVIG